MQADLAADLKGRVSTTRTAGAPLESKAGATYNPKQKQMPLWRRHARIMGALAALLCLALTSSRVSALGNAKSPPQALYSCINDGQPDQQLTTYQDFAYQKPAR